MICLHATSTDLTCSRWLLILPPPLSTSSVSLGAASWTTAASKISFLLLAKTQSDSQCRYSVKRIDTTRLCDSWINAWFLAKRKKIFQTFFCCLAHMMNHFRLGSFSLLVRSLSCKGIITLWARTSKRNKKICIACNFLLVLGTSEAVFEVVSEAADLLVWV